MAALEFVQSLLGKRIKVTLNDGRWLIGNFYCTDKDLNLCISNCEEYVSDEKPARHIGIAMVTKSSLEKIYVMAQGDTVEDEDEFGNTKSDILETELVTDTLKELTTN